ncbi:hypothetical protein IF1G_04321 [Cordyceps javanica]|uniref:Uncharacterized protein n=1 Tax=Cordyceps javanica TaxID=43265 RepID=A0A545V5S9_9HYPO|nr:hypothetical protein IF1G_04321 [Cordyceps javanica]
MLSRAARPASGNKQGADDFQLRDETPSHGHYQGIGKAKSSQGASSGRPGRERRDPRKGCADQGSEIHSRQRD